MILSKNLFETQICAVDRGAERIDPDPFQNNIRVTGPASRPPYHIVLQESNRRKTQYISRDLSQELSDGRIKVGIKIKNPRLYEHYLLKWRW